VAEGPQPSTDTRSAVLDGTLGAPVPKYMKPNADYWLDIVFQAEGTYDLAITPDKGSAQRIPIHVHSAAQEPRKVALVKGNLGDGNGDRVLWEAIRLDHSRDVQVELSDRRW
jgi:hypothetical protein